MFGRLCALVLLLGMARCDPPPMAPRAPGPGKATLTVATYNVHSEAAGDEPTLDAVGLPNADIVCLQEVNAAWERLLGRRYANEYPYMHFKTARGARGLAILSRFPVRDRGLLRAPHDWHPSWLVDIETPSGTIQVMNVHLRAWSARQRSLITGFLEAPADHEHEIRTFAAHMSASPAIVAGDFNEGVRGAAIRWLEQRGFQNALPTYHPGQPTWRGRSIAGAIDMTIDHVLFDASFTPLDAWVLDAGNSDHLPVVARLARERR